MGFWVLAWTRSVSGIWALRTMGWERVTGQGVGVVGAV